MSSILVSYFLEHGLKNMNEHWYPAFRYNGFVPQPFSLQSGLG
jgi:hypothetical protein